MILNMEPAKNITITILSNYYANQSKHPISSVKYTIQMAKECQFLIGKVVTNRQQFAQQSGQSGVDSL